MSGFDVPLVFQVKQSPHLCIATKVHIPAATAISAIWSTLWNEFLAPQMG
jgi:hypothetical protein